MDSITPDFGILYLEFLNGCAPIKEDEEISEWAQQICQIRRLEE